MPDPFSFSSQMGLDGHVALVLGGTATYIATIHACMPKNWLRTFIHREPVVFGGIALAGIAITMPLAIVPIRRRLGYPTDNAEWDGKKRPIPWW